MRTLPEPKQQKDALLRLQLVSSSQFQQLHGLTGLSGNKLGKLKRSEFKAIYEDFVQTADQEHLSLYVRHLLGRQGVLDKPDKGAKKKAHKSDKPHKSEKSNRSK
eukprot:TRINITY_DN3730_c0_g1_i5.p2 TRINITY_DN3730_c0_g1~~TRINITY_DN3730_c0_g1_i5.p2  ORF type:complete len:105 (+),score=23.96 TRINITY_DN3730_c0_g1_i5:548-862(+)